MGSSLESPMSLINSSCLLFVDLLLPILRFPSQMVFDDRTGVGLDYRRSFSSSPPKRRGRQKLVLVDLEDVVDDYSGKNETVAEVVVEQTNLDEGNVVVDDHSGKNATVEEVVVEQTNMDEGNTVVDDHSGKNATVEEVVDEGNAVVDDHSVKNATVEEVVDEENASVDEVVVEDNETLDEGVNEHTLDDFEFFDPLFGDQYEEQHHNEQADFQDQIHEHNQEDNNVQELEVDMRDFRDILETNVCAIGTEGVTDIGVVEGEIENENIRLRAKCKLRVPVINASGVVESSKGKGKEVNSKKDACMWALLASRKSSI
ncbi:hypothetical protein L1887_18766 [Cichorium endivia]|nr:hypothetical protein L1887_18766 [Cichorium endivia]